jgi:hypothetical protein
MITVSFTIPRGRSKLALLMSNGVDTALSLSGVALEIALAATLIRRGVWKRKFVFFFVYTAYSIINVIVLLVSAEIGSRKAYFTIYWATQAIYVVLGLLATNESFHKVFRIYYFRRPWFRFLVPAIVMAILSISIWTSLKHAPIQAGPVTIAYISFDLAANYMLAGVFGLFGIFVFFWHTKWQRHPFGIMLGFGVFSVTGMLANALRSDFGTKMNLIFSYGTAVAYIVACLIWLHAFIRPENDLTGGDTLQTDPSELVQLLDRHIGSLKKAKDHKRQ